MTVRATGRHRAGAPVSTPLTTMTAAIATKVPSASAARSGFVIAVSSGLVAGVGLPAQAADTTSDGATTAALKLPALAPAVDQVVVDQAVSAPATATVHFERSAVSASTQGSAPAADSTAKAAATVTSVSRSLARVAYGQQVAADQKPAQQTTGSTVATPTRTTRRSSRDGQRTIPAPNPTPRSVPVPANGSRGGAAVAIAARYLGVPYRYGGSSPAGFDCSGLVLYVYGQLGINLPRTASAQYGATRRVSRSMAQPGDLVFFFSGGGISHVGIYIGNGMMIAAPHTGARVQRQTIYSANVAFGRVV